MRSGHLLHLLLTKSKDVTPWVHFSLALVRFKEKFRLESHRGRDTAPGYVRSPCRSRLSTNSSVYHFLAHHVFVMTIAPFGMNSFEQRSLRVLHPEVPTARQDATASSLASRPPHAEQNSLSSKAGNLPPPTAASISCCARRIAPG